MTTRTISALFVSLTLSFASFAIDKVVYGEDDRLDIYEATNSLHLQLAKSTAAMIPNGKLLDTSDPMVKELKGDSLESRGICADAKFADQMTAANCSGFLVGKDLLVTAGHCIRSQSDCANSQWVFDYNMSHAGDRTENIPTENIYSCEKIIAQDLSRSDNNDYALIKLKREVTDRAPLTVRTEGKVATGTKIVVIGHPTGLPSKISAGDDTIVRGNDNSVYFVANLDTFGGNSGSAVFDSETGVVEGILVRGETDYEYDQTNGCRRPKKCGNNECRGEDVTRITNIEELMTIANQK